MGSNTTEAHPIIANRIKKAIKNGLKVIVIDPRKIDMVKFAHRHLQINVGTDIALINAFLRVIIKEN
ncbi:molybdopterin-dependent oxidoreductase, partial [Neobacillus niacini]